MSAEPWIPVQDHHYDPADWQTQHPLGSHMTYVGILENLALPVRVGKASRQGIRVKFLTGRPAGVWQTVHPDDLR